MNNRCDICKNYIKYDNKRLYDENKNLKEIVEKYSKTITNNLEEIEILENDNDDLNEQIKALEECIEYKDYCRNSLREQVHKREKEIEDLNTIIKCSNDMYASLLDENKELKDKIKMFEESDKHKDSTFSDLLVHHDLLIDQNADLKEENSKLLDTLVEKEKYIEKLEHDHAERINTLEKALLDSDRRFNIMVDKAKKFDDLLDELGALVDEYNE